MNRHVPKHIFLQSPSESRFINQCICIIIVGMKITLTTQEFSVVKRVCKKIERRFNFFKYQIRGDRFKAWTCTFELGGHWDIIDSFIKGAKYYPEIEILVNPSRAGIKDSVVYVPTNWRALRELIPLRRSGYISKLIAGSDIAAFPDMHDFLMADPAIDICLLESEWVKNAFVEELSIAGRKADVRVWAAGVDSDFWSPRRAPGENFDKALIYVKRSGANILPSVASVLERKNKEYQVIVYGEYVPEDYKKLLEQCDFVIILGESETQGIAMFQAWSMGRQTLVYDSPVIWAPRRRWESAASYASAAPYLTPQNGVFWKDTDELEYLLEDMLPRSPREWILEHYSNERAFASWLDVIKTV